MQCGLDQSSRCPRSGFKEQCEAFEAQLHLAQELRRPASVPPPYHASHFPRSVWGQQMLCITCIEHHSVSNEPAQVVAL